jgi:hypothetical protein
MSLSAADEKSEDDWNCIVEQQCRASIKPVPSVGRIKKRAECWTTHAPAIMAQADSPQGKILALLLGLEHESPLRTLSLDVEDELNVIFRKVFEGLNAQQVEVARMIVMPEPAVIAVQAPGGTGKTHCLSESVPILLQRDEEARLVITTNNNTALAKLVKEVVPHLANRLEPGERILVILSAMAKTTHAEAFAPFKQHLLVASIEELLEMVNKESANVKLSRGEEKMIEKYKTEMVNRPRFTEEKGLTELVVEKMGVPRVVFSTTAMIEEIDVVTERTTHLFIDEAGQSPINQLISIVCACPRLKKLLLTGDAKQLLNFVEDLPLAVRPAAFTSALKYALELSPSMVSLAQLIYSHRSHPEIIRCLSRCSYGDGIAAGVSAAQRSLLIGCPSFSLPARDSPIVLLHQTEPDMKESCSTSRLNPSQAANAATILTKLASALPNTSIICLCLYIGELLSLKELLRKFWPNGSPIRVVTVDGFQSQESDIIYLLTTRSVEDVQQQGPKRWGVGDPLKFVKDPRRATVALSRARCGLFVHGNLLTLAKGQIWHDFFVAAMEGTKVVSPSDFANYCDVGNFEYGALHLNFPRPSVVQEEELVPRGP